MNKVILMGRLTRDPDIRSTAGANPMTIARYTLAVDRRMRKDAANSGQQTADFISCVAFDRNAEFAEKYLQKGTKIALTGHIQTGSYQNKSGQTVYTTDVIVEDQEFAESKSSAQPTAQVAPLPEEDYVPADVFAGDGGFADIPSGDDELPFGG